MDGVPGVRNEARGLVEFNLNLYSGGSDSAQIRAAQANVEAARRDYADLLRLVEQQVRVSWHADDEAPPTMVDLQMTPEGDGTLLTLRHEHLPQDADHQALSQRWDAAMHRLTQV